MRKYIFPVLSLILAGSQTIYGQNANMPVSETGPTGTAINSVSHPDAFQSGPLNFVRTWVPYFADTDENAQMFQLDPYTAVYRRASMETKYTNGWGNAIETIQRGSTTGGKDIISFNDLRNSLTHYSFLPYTKAPFSQFQASAPTDQQSYYNNLYPDEGNTAAKESTVNYDNQIMTSITYEPGKSLLGEQRGTTTYTYFNIPGKAEVSNIPKLLDDNNQVTSSGYYDDNTLNVQDINDADGGRTLMIYDQNQRLIAKKVADASGSFLTTYYVYNSMGRLRAIIPPKAVALGDYNNSSYNYTYYYDGYGNITSTTKPGQASATTALGLTYTAATIYDTKLRPVLTQNAAMRTKGEYAFTIMDNRGNPVIQGFLYDNNAPDTWQGWLNDPSTTTVANGSLLYYLINGFTGTYPAAIPNCEITVVNYYDQYPQGDSVLSGRTFDAGFAQGYLFANDIPAINPFMHGMLTASKVKVLDSSSTYLNTWVYNVFFYDQKGRVIETQTRNPWNVSKWDKTLNVYDFSGNVIKQFTNYNDKSSSNKPSVTIAKLINRDEFNDNRLISIQQSIDNGAFKNIASYTYNDLRQTSKKMLGGVEGQNYDYNIRNQLTGINSDYVTNGCSTTLTNVSFGEKLSYDYGFSQHRYGGQAAGIIWRDAGTPPSNVPPLKAYGYSYDAEGRMTHAEFREFTDPTTKFLPPCSNFQGYNAYWNNLHEDYTVSNLTYDADGNILTANRKGTIPSGPVDIDLLTYQYNGNQLSGVKDDIDTNYLLGDFQDGNNCTSIVYVNGQPQEITATNCQDYTYDDDGNLKQDLNKHISNISYNEADQPLRVDFANGSSITNVYDASGDLVQKNIYNASTSLNDIYRYWGPFTYKNDSLQYILHDEGRTRWIADSNMYKLDFFVKDQQGNIRNVKAEDEYEARNYMATYEIAHANVENFIFNNVSSIRTIKPGATDSLDLESARLNGADSNRRIGTSLMLHVMAGDQFLLSADSYWEQDSTDERTYATPNVVLQSLFSTLAGGGATTSTGESNVSYLTGAYSSMSENLSAFQGIMDQATVDQTTPRAYINYMVFDEKMNFIPSQSGSIQINPTSGSWQSIGNITPVTLGQNGYVIFYESAPSYHNIYIDNFGITYYKGRLLQEQQYYPYGLTVNEGQTSDQPANKFLYEGKQYHDELGFDLYDFTARQYDPQLGRFWGIDPANQFPSGYTGKGDDPANTIDPSGMSTRTLNPQPNLLGLGIGGYNPKSLPSDGGLTIDGISDIGLIMNHMSDLAEDRASQGKNGGDATQKTDPCTSMTAVGNSVSSGIGLSMSAIGPNYSSDVGLSMNGIAPKTFDMNDPILGKGGADPTNKKTDEMLDKIGTNLGFADYSREGINFLRESPATISFISTMTSTSASETEWSLSLLSPAFHVAGVTFGTAGILLSVAQGGYDLSIGNYGGATKSGLNAIMGGVSTFGGPAGLIIGGIYFGIDQTIGWDHAIPSMIETYRNDQQLINMKIMNYSDFKN